jgi:hypothetical protein
MNMNTKDQSIIEEAWANYQDALKGVRFTEAVHVTELEEGDHIEIDGTVVTLSLVEVNTPGEWGSRFADIPWLVELQGTASSGKSWMWSSRTPDEPLFERVCA